MINTERGPGGWPVDPKLAFIEATAKLDQARREAQRWRANHAAIAKRLRELEGAHPHAPLASAQSDVNAADGAGLSDQLVKSAQTLLWAAAACSDELAAPSTSDSGEEGWTPRQIAAHVAIYDRLHINRLLELMLDGGRPVIQTNDPTFREEWEGLAAQDLAAIGQALDLGRRDQIVLLGRFDSTAFDQPVHDLGTLR